MTELIIILTASKIPMMRAVSLKNNQFAFFSLFLIKYYYMQVGKEKNGIFQKTQEEYEGGNLGCTGLTLLAKYNKGVAYNINSYKDEENKIYYLFF